MGMRGRAAAKKARTPSRAAVSDSARDLDQQARLAVEGWGDSSLTSDPETVLCTRSLVVMEDRNEGNRDGH